MAVLVARVVCKALWWRWRRWVRWVVRVLWCWESSSCCCWVGDGDGDGGGGGMEGSWVVSFLAEVWKVSIKSRMARLCWRAWAAELRTERRRGSVMCWSAVMVVNRVVGGNGLGYV